MSNRLLLAVEVAAAEDALTRARDYMDAHDPDANTRITMGDVMAMAFYATALPHLDAMDEDEARRLLSNIRLLALRVMPQGEVN